MFRVYYIIGNTENNAVATELPYMPNLANLWYGILDCFGYQRMNHQSFQISLISSLWSQSSD